MSPLLSLASAHLIEIIYLICAFYFRESLYCFKLSIIKEILSRNTKGHRMTKIFKLGLILSISMTASFHNSYAGLASIWEQKASSSSVQGQNGQEKSMQGKRHGGAVTVQGQKGQVKSVQEIKQGGVVSIWSQSSNSNNRHKSEYPIIMEVITNGRASPGQSVSNNNAFADKDRRFNNDSRHSDFKFADIRIESRRAHFSSVGGAISE